MKYYSSKFRCLLLFCIQVLVLNVTGCGNSDGGNNNASAADPQSLPRLTFSDLQYQGSFRVSIQRHNSANAALCNQPNPGSKNRCYFASTDGAITYNPDNHSLFVAGHQDLGGVAEFPVPTPSTSASLDQLPLVTPLQPFMQLLDQVPNPNKIERIRGLLYLDGELLVNGLEYYGVTGSRPDTTLRVVNASGLEGSRIDGYFEIPFAEQAAGWMSPIPSEWHSVLGASYLIGSSYKFPGTVRQSIGPSAFGFDPYSIVGQSNPQAPSLTTFSLYDFSTGNYLDPNFDGGAGPKNYWTRKSHTGYGVIIPGTRTYLVVGSSAGHNSGIAYKKDPRFPPGTCPGYCLLDPKDRSPHYYWMFDVNDFVKVKNGSMQPHEVKPYEHGTWTPPFPAKEIPGATFDPVTGTLYVILQGADKTQQIEAANGNVIATYTFSP